MLVFHQGVLHLPDLHRPAPSASRISSFNSSADGAEALKSLSSRRSCWTRCFCASNSACGTRGASARRASGSCRLARVMWFERGSFLGAQMRIPFGGRIPVAFKEGFNSFQKEIEGSIVSG